MIGNLILISTLCSARCFHCPFGNKKNEKHLEQEKIIEKINNSHFPLVVLSGGEPFEHPQLKDILKEIRNIKDKIFRLCTGGHIPLKKFFPHLKNMTNFTGISMGTDILFPQRNDQILSEIFWKNIEDLNNNNIDYSITLTLGNDIKLNTIETIMTNHPMRPAFILIQNRDDQHFNQSMLDSIIQIIDTNFPGIVIHYENLN